MDMTRNPKGFLYSSLRNVCIDMGRTKKWRKLPQFNEYEDDSGERKEIEFEELDPLEQVICNEEKKELGRRISCLSETKQETVRLWLKELPSKLIGEKLRINHATVRGRIHVVKKELVADTYTS